MVDNTVFFSFQSDLPRQETTNPIRNAIDKALKGRKNWKRDEATRSVPGAPHIARKLEEKIEVAAIFVADVSTVKKGWWGKRSFQNPNVLYELGYATSHLGWDRIVLLSSSKYGKGVKDLPFDLEKNRHTVFKVSGKNDRAGKDDLNLKIRQAIETIISQDPPRPSQKIQFTKDAKKRTEDLKQLETLLSEIDFSSIDRYLNDTPNMIFDDYMFGIIGTEGIFYSSLWSLHDSTISEIIENLISAWKETLSYDRRYNSSKNGKYYIFSNNYGYEDPQEVKSDENAIAVASRQLYEAKEALISRLKTHYPEIDIKVTFFRRQEIFNQK